MPRHTDLLQRRPGAALCRLAAGLLAFHLAVPAAALASDAVQEWNQHALALTLGSGQSPAQQTRTMAIVQVAVHDAVNVLTREFDTYLNIAAVPDNGASPEAAAIAAAYHALKGLFPGASNLDGLFSASLTNHGVPPGDPGLTVGQDVAALVLAVRSNDGAASASFPYTAPNAGAPGVFTTTGAALLPGWGNVTPFVLRAGSQFRPNPPPALDSIRYARDYDEVRQIGEKDTLLRSAEQTQIVEFWRASPAAIWNPVLVQVLATRSLDLSATARAFALLYLAAADASIGCWDAKYTYNYWRPQPAIVRGGEDGNDRTVAVPGWTPQLTTPPHPEYPSGHGCNSAAMATILERLFGKDPKQLLTVTATGVTRQWKTFEEGVREVIDARVYSGIHFRTSDEVGAELGRKVAQFVFSHALRDRGHSRR